MSECVGMFITWWVIGIMCMIGLRDSSAGRQELGFGDHVKFFLVALLGPVLFIALLLQAMSDD